MGGTCNCLAYFNEKDLGMIIFEGQILDHVFTDPKIYTVTLQNMGEIITKNAEFLNYLLEGEVQPYIGQILKYINDPNNYESYERVEHEDKRIIAMYIEFLENKKLGNLLVKYLASNETENPFEYMLFNNGLVRLKLPPSFKKVYDDWSGRTIGTTTGVDPDESYYLKNIWQKRNLLIENVQNDVGQK